MRKILNKRIFVSCVISLLFMTVVVFVMQTVILKRDATESMAMRLSDVADRLDRNEAELTELISQLNEDYIAKADAFAEMVALDSSILTDQARLDEIAAFLLVDELHVTDVNGVIQWGSVPGYFGFDFSQSDQAAEFMKIIADPSLKIAQEAQPNGAAGIYFQYIGVSRKDEPGIVQVGITPERLTNKVKNNEIGNVLSEIVVGDSGYVFAVTVADKTVASHKDESLVGKTAVELSLPEELLAGTEKLITTRIGEDRFYCRSVISGDYVLIAAYPESEISGERSLMTLIFNMATILMLLVISLMTNHTLKTVTISGLNQILDKMQVVAGGELNTEIAVRTCPEYETLSKGINAMLANIRAEIEETLRLNQEQQRLFGEITAISSEIGVQSGQMQEVAVRLSDGSALQSSAVAELSGSFAEITGQIQESTKAARDASELSVETSKQLDGGARKLNEMQAAMQKIEEAAAGINKIVKTIDDIAFQTNILALNASVEAARAGQHGKGFAVVAEEVRSLAGKSAEATKGTEGLIEATRRAVTEGARIADETAQQLRAIIAGIGKSNTLIDEIAAASETQTHTVQQVSDKVERISEVVAQNAQISANAEQTAYKLDEQARALEALFTGRQ